MPSLFAAALFLSAFLLFWMQPLFARMVLPLLGGTPAVWNTCMVFFQFALLAGYAYAHLCTRLLEPRRQAIFHVGLLLAVFIFLPFAVQPEGAPPAANPAAWLFLLLLAGVGVPAFVISATAPLVQAWFFRTGHRSSGDPYFLYGASNAGSLLALLAYPVFIEPKLQLAGQSRAWAVCYAVLVLLIASCAAVLLLSPAARESRSPETGTTTTPTAASVSPAPDGRTKWRWLALSFVPSSLLLGVTSYITTDIAAVPLLWVIPLALYLLSFVVAFARRPPLPHRWLLRAQPVFLAAALFVLIARVQEPLAAFPLHLLAFFLTTTVCCGELARSRPRGEHLTGFYLWISAGGVLGGLLNALAAPLIFTEVTEYPLMLVAACFLRPRASAVTRPGVARVLDFALPAALAAAAAGALVLIVRNAAALENPLLWCKGVLLLGFLGCLAFAHRPTRLGLGAGAVLLASALTVNTASRVTHRERNFFGTLRVEATAGGGHVFYHGSTIHGAQVLEHGLRREPLLYHHRSGPLGELISLQGRRLVGKRIAVAGLGAGAIAAYGKPGQELVFYEIDPAVERLARDTRYFTYLADSPARVSVVVGDARLKLAAAPDHGYAMIILDAFSSDAVPVHLLTREALALYLTKLSDDGVLIFNVSNKHLDLTSVLTALARDAGLASAAKEYIPTDIWQQGAMTKASSLWMVMGRDMNALGALYNYRSWRVLHGDPGARVWTDSYSDIVGAIRARRREQP